MEDSATCCSRPILKLNIGDIHVITLRGQDLVSRTDDDPLSLLPVLHVRTSPCVPAPHPHVFAHLDVLPVHTGTLWMYIRGLEEGCSACHRTAPHRTAPHRTAPHRTAPHRTAPHRTAPHRTTHNTTTTTTITTAAHNNDNDNDTQQLPITNLPAA